MDQTINITNQSLKAHKASLEGGISESYVTEDQRARILDLIEEAVKDKRKKEPWREKMLRMFDHSIRAREQEMGLMFDKSVRRWIYGRKPTENVPAEPLLTMFLKIMPVRMTKWSHRDGHSRKLQVEFSPAVEEILFNSAGTNESLVGLLTGLPVDFDEIREKMRRDASARSFPARCKEIQELVDRLNAGWKPEDDARIRAGIPDAYRAIDRLKHPDPHRLRRIKREARAALRAIRVQPQPFYATTENTARIYSVGRSFLGVNATVRRALLGKTGWVGLDLDKAQLRIAAAKWGGLEDVLESVEQGDVWRRILEPADLWPEAAHERDRAKRIAKGVIYGAVFGSTLSQTVRRLRREEKMGKDVVRRLTQGSIVTKLYAAAKEQLDALMAGEVKVDAFGRTIQVDQALTGHDKRREARSKLAEWVQSFEVAIMLGASEFAKAWLHDGVWVDPSDVEAALTEIKTQASHLGITVKVEVSGAEDGSLTNHGGHPAAAFWAGLIGEAGSARLSPIHTTKIANVGCMGRRSIRRDRPSERGHGFQVANASRSSFASGVEQDPFSYDWGREPTQGDRGWFPREWKHPAYNAGES